MRALAGVLLAAIVWQGGSAKRPEPRDFQFRRAVTVSAGAEARACAVIDGAMYERSPTLGDMRLFAGANEVPYALTASGTTTPGSDPAKVLNAGVKAGHVVFDLEMPGRAYSNVNLELGGTDYLATAKVTGLKDVNETGGTALGTFTVFDLAGQKLGSNGTLPLAEASFPFLHVDLEVNGVAGKPAPAVTVLGATIPPSREAQTIYTAVAQTANVVQRGRESVATFALPAHVPVERVSFAVAAGVNFSRAVEVRARAVGSRAGMPGEEIVGEISRVRMKAGGKEVREEQLGVAATVGANGEGNATVEVAVENGDDQALPITAVRLEMRQRKLCFDPVAAGATLYYGDAGLSAPVYDYTRLFTPGDASRAAVLGVEEANPLFVAAVVRRSWTERHPELLWVGLLGMVGVLGVVAFRSAKRV